MTDNFTEKNMVKNEEIYCKSVATYDDVEILQNAVSEICDYFGAATKINGSTKILLKPNLLARHHPSKAVTTHPAIVKAVILQCIKYGAKPENITVADSAGGVYNRPTMQSIGKSAGLISVCEQTGANFYLNCEYYTVNINGELLKSTYFIKPFETADFIINLPKLKTHVMTGLSCATKNLFGAVPGLYKAGLHAKYPQKELFGTALVDVCEAVNADLHIVDAVIAHEGNGPSGGNARYAGAVFGGVNPYAVDVAAANIIGISSNTITYLKSAKSRNLYTIDEQNMCDVIKGDKSAVANIKDFKLPTHSTDVDFAKKAPGILKYPARVILNFLVPKPKIIKEKCIGCAKCAEICPAKTIVMKDKKARVQKSRCIKCYCCHEMCPVKAITL